MRYLPLLLVALLAFSACQVGHPLTQAPAENNTTYKVEYLFQNEGCKVYRFMDGGHYIYYTNCQGTAVATTDSTQQQTITNIVPRTTPHQP